MNDGNRKFEPNNFYHIVNHAIGKENLFREEANIGFFIKKYLKYIPRIADTYAYCLMSNHIHFLIKTHTAEDLIRHRKFKDDFHVLIARELSNVLISYAKAYNKVYNRKGSLWIKPTKRFLVTNETHLKTVIKYIHCNPINHNFSSYPEDWEHSSYKIIIYNKPSFVNKEEVLKLFGGQSQFIEYHRSNDFNKS